MTGHQAFLKIKLQGFVIFRPHITGEENHILYRVFFTTSAIFLESGAYKRSCHLTVSEPAVIVIYEVNCVLLMYGVNCVSLIYEVNCALPRSDRKFENISLIFSTL